MVYKAKDIWNTDDSLQHRSHKYYMKVGEGENARYFYSPAEYAAYRIGLTKGHKPTGEQLMADIRTRRANALNKMEANKQRIKNEKISRNKDRLNRERAWKRREEIYNKAEEAAKQNRESIKRKQDQTRRRNEARQARFDEIKQERSTDSTRRAIAYQRKQMAAARKEADAKRQARQTKHDEAVKQKSGRNTYLLSEKIINPSTGKTVVTSSVGPSAHDVKRAARKTYYSAKNTIKKAANSKTVKTAKKKAKKAVKSAYSRGRKFISNFFK